MQIRNALSMQFVNHMISKHCEHTHTYLHLLYTGFLKAKHRVQCTLYMYVHHKFRSYFIESDTDPFKSQKSIFLGDSRRLIAYSGLVMLCGEIALCKCQKELVYLIIVTFLLFDNVEKFWKAIKIWDTRFKSMTLWHSSKRIQVEM